MPYDDDLANRVRESLKDTDAVTELRMFGGWGITVHGNMAVGVMNDDLIVRVGPHRYEEALARPGTRPFDFTGRSMTGWVYVEGDAVAKKAPLDRWVRSGVDFAQSLPPKTTPTRNRRRQVQSRLRGLTQPRRPILVVRGHAFIGDRAERPRKRRRAQ